MDKKDLKFVEETLGLTSEILEPWKEKISLKNFKIGELILNKNQRRRILLDNFRNFEQLLTKFLSNFFDKIRLSLIFDKNKVCSKF